MNTGLRRFLLRFAVGLLAFLLGISAAWALGRFKPFRTYRHKGCGSYRSWNAPPPHAAFDLQREPAVMHRLVLINPDGSQVKGKLGHLPPLLAAPPPPAQAPEPALDR